MFKTETGVLRLIQLPGKEGSVREFGSRRLWRTMREFAETFKEQDIEPRAKLHLQAQ